MKIFDHVKDIIDYNFTKSSLIIETFICDKAIPELSRHKYYSRFHQTRQFQHFGLFFATKINKGN